jgi:hypothetical protein
VKRNKIVLSVAALLVLGIGGRFAWILLIPPTVRSKQVSESPDKRYTATALSRWRSDFWGRAPHEFHYVFVEAADGRVIRQMHTDEEWTGWPKDGSIEWATNSSTVTFIFKTEEAEKTRLTLDVNQ